MIDIRFLTPTHDSEGWRYDDQDAGVELYVYRREGESDAKLYERARTTVLALIRFTQEA